MTERRIGLIPYAITLERQSQGSCAIFVTDLRTILVFREPKKSIKMAFSDMYGKGADLPVQARPAIDFRTIEIDKLAAMNDNVSVMHSSIEKFSCGKGVGGYGVWVLYRDEKGKKQGLTADFEPHPELMKRLKAEGKKSKEIRREYAERCQMVFKRALPVRVAQEGEWKL